MGGCHRNTLQYITVSPGQEGCTWLRPPTHTCIQTHTHNTLWFYQPTWIRHRPEPTQADEYWDDSVKTHNWAVCPKRSKFKYEEMFQHNGGSRFKFTMTHVTPSQFSLCFIATNNLLFSSPTTTCSTHVPRKAYNWYKLLRMEMAKWGA